MTATDSQPTPPEKTPGPADAQTLRAYQAYQATRHFGSLDGIRCLSILLVIWHHTEARYWGRGFLGVDMFFVLSGYLIVTLLLREQNRHGSISLRAFYARRSLRIFPIYYGLLGLLGLAYLAKPASNTAEDYWALLPFYLAYLCNWMIPQAANLGIMWSLACEEQFYLIWPMAQKYLKRWALPVLGIVIVSQLLLTYNCLDGLFGGAVGYYQDHLEVLQITFLPICLGVGLAHLLHHPKSYRWAYRLLGKQWAPVLALVMIALAMNPPGAFDPWRPLVQLLMAGLLLTCVIREDHALAPALAQRFIRRIGAVSYGMYLYHLFALHIATAVLTKLGLAGQPLVTFVLTFLITVIAAELSYRAVEKPILKLRKHFRPTPATTPTDV